MVWISSKGELIFISNPFCLMDVSDLLLYKLAPSVARDGKAMYGQSEHGIPEFQQRFISVSAFGRVQHTL